MNPTNATNTTTSSPFRSIDSIATRASFWAAIAALVIVVIFAFITIIEEKQTNYESEKKRLGNIAAPIARSVAAEILVGDSRSLSVLLTDYQKKYGLHDIELLDEPTGERPEWWHPLVAPGEAVWTEKLPGVTPSRWIRLVVEARPTDGYSGLWNLFWICIPLLFFGIFVTLRIQRDLRRSIVIPIQELARDPERWSAKEPKVANETVVLHQHLIKYIKERDIERDTAERFRIEASIGEVAAQVAHDIRSPLAALDMVAAHLEQIPEEKRIIIRTAISRIRDIANGLLEKHRTTTVAPRPEEMTAMSSEFFPQEAGGLELLSGLIDSLVTEKRLQFRSKWGVQIEAPLSSEGYGLFAKVNGSDFKRVLSNIINNAVEAVGDRGRVKVELGSSSTEKAVFVRVKDDGPGIPPEVMPRLMGKGETFGKAGGSGLGLYSAKKKVEEWGGSINITTAPAKGTSVEVKVPKADTPLWFVSSLVLPSSSKVVVLDDDTTIHQIWEGRFESLQLRSQDIEFIHLSTAPEFTRYVLEHRSALSQPGTPEENLLFLVDYELIGSAKTGLDLIEELGIGTSSILVTSRFEEKAIRRRAIGLGIRMIPKSLAGFVPIHVVRRKVSTSTL